MNQEQAGCARNPVSNIDRKELEYIQRGTGRTTSMLFQAIETAHSGAQVMVVMASYHEAESARKRVSRIWMGGGIQFTHVAGLVAGRAHLGASKPDAVFYDHHAIQLKLDHIDSQIYNLRKEARELCGKNGMPSNGY